MTPQVFIAILLSFFAGFPGGIIFTIWAHKRMLGRLDYARAWWQSARQMSPDLMVKCEHCGAPVEPW